MFWLYTKWIKWNKKKKVRYIARIFVGGDGTLGEYVESVFVADGGSIKVGLNNVHYLVL